VTSTSRAPRDPDERSFRPDPSSIAVARRFVTERLASTAVDVNAAEQMTAELAANAVQHARSDYRVRVVVEDAKVRVEVANDDPEMLPEEREPDDSGGRGLHIVRALSGDWGTESKPDEKVVWFELPRERTDDGGR
jgi:anti-sigma regulatory factor (Ser/Thr protein kinase)